MQDATLFWRRTKAHNKNIIRTNCIAACLKILRYFASIDECVKITQCNLTN